MHPIVAQLTPSEEQRPAVVVRDQDVAVTAGAGAGKTRTLVARYLSLLAELEKEQDLRSVVAITFTKKAAREMRNRVREEIRTYLDREDLAPGERKLWRGHYEALDGARIGTIHSLCGEILRHHPAAMGIDPRFDMLEEGEMALLQVQAVEAALGWAADIPELVPLFGIYGERELSRHVGAMLQRRLDVADARALQGIDNLWVVWEPVLVAPMRGFLEDPSVQDDLAALQALRAEGLLARAEAAGDALPPDLAAALAHIDAIRAAHGADDWSEISRHLAPLRETLKLKGRKANWAPVDPKATIRSLRDRYDEMLGDLLKKEVDLALDRRLASEIVPRLVQVYDVAAEAYETAKARRQALDFDDLEALALDLLETNAEARAYWQQAVAALLVDEFQDTNGRQRDLLHALSGDAGKLFIVGDGKQSIYRFRGADVTVFRTERAAIEAGGAGVTLATSYRAHRDLVWALNALLGPVLGQGDPARAYIEPFAPLDHFREAPADGLKPPYVEMLLAVGTKSDGALDRAAQALCERLARLVAGREITLAAHDDESGEKAIRPLNYGDIAILCRASTSFPTYEAALEAAGVPYLTIAGRGFYDRPEVRDLLNTLTALADPADDLALAGLLRSPAMGLSDMALYRLRQAQRAPSDREATSQGNAPSLWETLRRDDLTVLEDEGARAHAAAVLIHDLHQRVGRTPVADVLKAFLDRTAYRAILLRAGEARAANNVGKLLADAQASGIVAVDAFVAYLAELRDVAPREGEARTLAAGAVQIMTVHQAKGLEFPVVVLGDAARDGRGPAGLLIDPALGLVPPYEEKREAWSGDGSRTEVTITSLAYRAAKLREQDQESAESDRLLYVAATRARELLMINGTASAYKSGLGLGGWLGRLDAALHLAEMAPICDPEGGAVHEIALDLDGQPVRCTLYEPQAAIPAATVTSEALAPLRMPDDLALLAPIVGAEPQVDEALREAERDPPKRVWRVVPERAQTWAPSWVVGELVHLALRDWSFADGGGESGGRDFYRWSAAAARNAGLTDEGRIQDAVRRAARMLVRFQATALFAAMDAAAQRLLEVPYSVLDAEGRLDAGIMDALWCDETAHWHLVEFKTDRIKDAHALERQLQEHDYIEQVARYLAAAEHLLGRRPEPALCFLDVAGRVRLVTDRWDG